MIISQEDDYFKVIIYREYIPDFDIFDKDKIGELFKDILITLEKKYNLSGLLDIDVYENLEYGLVMEIRNVVEYYDEIDVKIHFHLDSIFMCEIDSNDIILYDDIYYYKDKFYSLYNKKIDSNVIYKDCYEIIDKGIKIC